MTAAQMAVLIAYDEIRSSHIVSSGRVKDSHAAVVRRYVRLADTLDSLWLSDLPSVTAPQDRGEMGKGS